MKIVTRSAFLMLAVLACFGSVGFSQQASPSLEDTATWLQNAYANHGLHDWGTGSWRRSLTISGCNARMITTSGGKRGDGTYNSARIVQDVKLQDMDPASVKTFSFGHVTLETTDGKKLIKGTTTFLDGSSAASMDSTADWGLDDDQYMERTKTAWIHAIELCGGKSSTF
jgi:hypothetical protein